ncbi:hypothetical protein OpiT1DRAFT_05346 [Opitutaceae bacterium TAV1]|nr:hypothetical protein OpiT1DRAFT_05346 [Opitutaceae bacterium TAV1]
MKAHIKTLLIIIALVPFLNGCDPLSGRGFTPWMTYKEMGEFLAPLEKKDETNKNFWDHGHWLTAVEGRWDNGIPQFRLKIGDSPKEKKHGWFWWYNQSQESFNQHIHELSDQGFVLVQHNSFEWPDGSRRFSGVWHKIE